MIITVTDQEFLQLQKFILEKTEIEIGDNKKYLIETRLSSLVIEAGCKTFTEFFNSYLMTRGAESRLYLEKFIHAITTNETYWFRDDYPFNYLKNIFFPKMAEKIKTGEKKSVRIWSAAASFGQEAYSVAMTALEFQRENVLSYAPNEWLSIFGTDISCKAVEKSVKAIYSDNDMSRGLSQDFKKLYFRQVGNRWVVNEQVRSLVQFTQYNLQVPFPDNWGLFDVILLRNVIIYFSDPFKKILLKRIAGKITNDGVLFLGTGESVGGYTQCFKTQEYQKAARVYRPVNNEE